MSEGKIYMGNLSRHTEERDVEKFLRSFRGVSNITVKTGYAFAEFEDRREAEAAVRDLNGRTLGGRRVRVEHTRGRELPPGRHTGYRLIVENLAASVSWQDLKDFMRQAGEVTYTNVANGEGFADFESIQDMEYAIRKLDGSELGGKRIRIYQENKRSGERRSRSRSRSRSWSRMSSRGRSPRRVSTGK